MLDAFDVYFHRDPFEVLNATDSMILVEEGWLLQGAGLNAWWLHDCYPHDADKVGRQQTLCTGTIYGPSELFLKFVALMLELWPKVNCPWDQPVMNYLVHTGEFQRSGVPVRTVGCNGPVMTLARCGRDFRLVNGVKEPFNKNGVIPHVVHQWKQWEVFTRMYVDRCDLTEYMDELQARSPVDLNWSAPVRDYNSFLFKGDGWDR
jgi:hypothetical protein